MATHGVRHATPLPSTHLSKVCKVMAEPGNEPAEREEWRQALLAEVVGKLLICSCDDGPHQTKQLNHWIQRGARGVAQVACRQLAQHLESSWLPSYQQQHRRDIMKALVVMYIACAAQQ